MHKVHVQPMWFLVTSETSHITNILSHILHYIHPLAHHASPQRRLQSTLIHLIEASNPHCRLTRYYIDPPSTIPIKIGTSICLNYGYGTLLLHFAICLEGLPSYQRPNQINQPWPTLEAQASLLTGAPAFTRAWRASSTTFPFLGWACFTRFVFHPFSHKFHKFAQLQPESAVENLSSWTPASHKNSQASHRPR